MEVLNWDQINQLLENVSSVGIQVTGQMIVGDFLPSLYFS